MLVGSVLLAGESPAEAAVNVTVGGKNYLVESTRYTLSNYETLLQKQPWYNNPSLANQFAQALGDQLGYSNAYTMSYSSGPLNVNFPSTYGPVFIYKGSYPVPTTNSWGAVVYGPKDSFPLSGPQLTAFLASYASKYSATIGYANNVVTYEGPLDKWEFFGISSPTGDFVATATPVPGPLPIAGAATAFGVARRMRKRIASARRTD